MFLSCVLAAFICASLNIVTSDTQLDCLNNEHIEVGMLKNDRLADLAKKRGDRLLLERRRRWATGLGGWGPFTTSPNLLPRPQEIATIDPNTPGTITAYCTPKQDLILEKHLCTDLLGSKESLAMLDAVSVGKYLVVFWCNVDRNEKYVQACCAYRTTKRKRN